MKGLIVFFLLLQYGAIGVFLLTGEFYTKKRHVYRDLIPFFWFFLIIIALFGVAYDKWKDLE